jgi:hypothetical protein
MVSEWSLSGRVVLLPSWHTFAPMLVKLGALVSEVAGSIGGMTMQRSPNGTVARSKPLPIRRQGKYSATARQRLATLNLTWGTLTPTEKGDWDTFAGTVSWYNRFGDPITGTGYMAFLKCNASSHVSAAENSQQPLQLTPPLSTLGVLPAAPDFVYDLATDTLSLQSTDAATDSHTSLFMFASQPFRAGRRANYRPMPFLGWAKPAEVMPYDLTANYVLLHGRLPDASTRESAFLRVQAADTTYQWPSLDTVLPLVYK